MNKQEWKGKLSSDSTDESYPSSVKKVVKKKTTNENLPKNVVESQNKNNEFL